MKPYTVDKVTAKQELEKLKVDSLSEIIKNNPEVKTPKAETRIKTVECRFDPVKTFLTAYKSVLSPDKLILNQSLNEAIKKIGNYFLGMEGKLDLNKAVYLEGDYGLGKTQLMSGFQKWINQNFSSSGNGFTITSIEEIIDHYKKEKNIDRFVMNHADYGYNRPRHLLINEFGKEIKDKIFGTEAQQIINSLMMRRYEVFQVFGKLTHVTTNINPDNVTEDKALHDRYIEMFNFIKIEGKSFRK